jgi:regulator of sigma E protease
MVGEDEESDEENAFCKKKVWKRMTIVVAGAVMNLLLGFLLMLAVVLFQGPIGSTTVAGFNNDAVSNAQLQVNDEILEVGGTKVHSSNELAYEISNKGYQPVDILVERNGEEKLLKGVNFKTDVSDGAKFGVIDFKVYQEERTFLSIMEQTFFRSVSTVKMVYDSLTGLVTGRFGVEAVSGPVGVAQVVGDAAQMGILSFIYIVSVLSINLGVINLLPFPALDGGRFLLLAIEGIRRKPLNRNVEGYINFIGIVILFAFMIFISFKDVIKLIF